MKAKEDENISLWLRGDLKQWDTLTADCRLMPIKKNAILFLKGDPAENAYVVKSGRIRMISIDESGNEKHIVIAEVGSIIGEIACLTESTFPLCAQAIVNSQLIIVPAEIMAQRVKTYWSIAQKIFEFSYKKQRALIKQIESLSFSCVEQRVVQTLINIIDEYGIKNEEGIIAIDLKFTHQDVANMANASRVSVSKTFGFLYDNLIISRTRNHLIINDMNALYDLIYKQP